MQVSLGNEKGFGKWAKAAAFTKYGHENVVMTWSQSLKKKRLARLQLFLFPNDTYIGKIGSTKVQLTVFLTRTECFHLILSFKKFF